MLQFKNPRNISDILTAVRLVHNAPSKLGIVFPFVVGSMYSMGSIDMKRVVVFIGSESKL
jgi:hypothetical protein